MPLPLVFAATVAAMLTEGVLTGGVLTGGVLTGGVLTGGVLMGAAALRCVSTPALLTCRTVLEGACSVVDPIDGRRRPL